MKILIATDTFYPDVNGASYFTQRLAEYLVKAGHDVLVVAPNTGMSNTIIDRYGVTTQKMWGVPLFVNGMYMCLPFLIRPAVRKVVREFNPDIVHLQGHFFLSREVFLTARKLGIPYVGTNHFMPENLTHYLHLPHFITNIINNIGWLHFKLTFRHIKHITTPTESAAQILKARTKLDKQIQAISCGLDLERFKPKPRNDELRKKYNIPNKPILLYLGRLDREKNVDQVLRALPEVLKNIDIQFVVAGKGMERKAWEVLAKNLGVEKNVTFTGFIADEEMPDLYNLADCYIITSTVELQCITCMEAIACGVPVIVANALALPELVKEGNGLLVTPGDINEIKDSILKIFLDESLRKQMSAKGLAFMKKHDIHETIKKFEDIYTRAIKGDTV